MVEKREFHRLIAKTCMKVIRSVVALAFTVFPILNVDFQNFFYLENIGQGHEAQHLQWRHSMAST